MNRKFVATCAWIIGCYLLATVCTCNALYGQTIVAPGVKAATSFAIIIDEETLHHSREAVTAYKEMLEQKERLATYIVSANWKHPSEVRSVLQKLNAASPILEGAVLIGNIPVPMIRNAQHMASAFKMDELKFSREKSSVASDRYYDDFDLQFRCIGQDEKRPLWFYFELEEQSPQSISSDIYTARIISHQPGAAAWKEISDFLRKAVAARAGRQSLDQLLAFTGGGYNSESLTAWADEQLLLRECFPLAFASAANNRVLNFRMDTAMKQVILDELQRPHLSLAYLSEHGDIEKQYITNEPSGKIVTAEVATIRPSARMIVFNACYNGSFHHPANIAGGYLFNDGGVIVAQGNTVNVLQDKYALQLAGLLSDGVRAGIWNSQTNSLETHLLGDPTWRFGTNNINSELVIAWNKAPFWKKRLQHTSQAQRSLALTRLFRLNAGEAPQLAVHIYDTASAAGERMQCLFLLAASGSELFNDVLMKALFDPHEYIRRKAADWCARSGDSRFIAPLVKLLTSRPNDERVVWSARRSLAVMDPMLVRKQIEVQAAAGSALLKQVNQDEQYAARTIAVICSRQEAESKRIQAIRLLRNNHYHLFVPQLLAIVSDSTESVAIRQHVIEATGWFSCSYRMPLLLQTFKAICDNPASPEMVRKEAIQSIARLVRSQLL